MSNPIIPIKVDKRIEIVSSTIPTLSSMSNDSRQAVKRVLSKKYKHVGISIVNNLADLDALVVSRPDLVFLGMKYIPLNPNLGWKDTNRLWLSDYFNQHDIAFTGSEKLAHELELNKPQAKQKIKAAGLETSPFMVVGQDKLTNNSAQKLGYPLFVKPTDRGAGLGVDSKSLVHNRQQLLDKVQQIMLNFQSESLVEQYLPGREFSVAILKDNLSENYKAMPIELVAQPDSAGIRIFSQAVKTANTERVLLVEDQKLQQQLNELALGAFNALGARDYGRIDIRLNSSGVPQFLEANLLPSLIDRYGNFPKACAMNLNLSFEQMLNRIVSLAFSRSADITSERELGTSNLVFSMPA